ncbi:MAG: hypothetical protein HQL37_03740 [Alphaproteobacteria bacterium]|nr:hypothetical protein [Alphaproteobacteria bacterium]
MPTAGPSLDAGTFVKRLLAACGEGQNLGDPRSPGTIVAWTVICEGFDDDALKTIIPTAIRLLFRKSDTALRLKTARLYEGVSLQHESIAPYVIAYRRMRAIKRGEFPDAGRLLAETRREMRELSDRFHQILNEAIALQTQNLGLRKDLSEARADSERFRKEAQLARNTLDDAAARALNKLALSLQNLREILDMRTNDPNSTLAESASLTVQSYYMVLEDLGQGDRALKLTKRILGHQFPGNGLF